MLNKDLRKQKETLKVAENELMQFKEEFGKRLNELSREVCRKKWWRDENI